MVNQLVEQQSIRLLKHVIRCYMRLSDNPRAREALRQCLPDRLRDSTFSNILKDDLTTKRCLNRFYYIDTLAFLLICLILHSNKVSLQDLMRSNKYRRTFLEILGSFLDIL